MHSAKSATPAMPAAAFASRRATARIPTSRFAAVQPPMHRLRASARLHFMPLAVETRTAAAARAASSRPANSKASARHARPATRFAAAAAPASPPLRSAATACSAGAMLPRAVAPAVPAPYTSVLTPFCTLPLVALARALRRPPASRRATQAASTTATAAAARTHAMRACPRCCRPRTQFALSAASRRASQRQVHGDAGDLHLEGVFRMRPRPHHPSVLLQRPGVQVRGDADALLRVPCLSHIRPS
jgi:hypothetical protein